MIVTLGSYGVLRNNVPCARRVVSARGFSPVPARENLHVNRVSAGGGQPDLFSGPLGEVEVAAPDVRPPVRDLYDGFPTAIGHEQLRAERQAAMRSRTLARPVNVPVRRKGTLEAGAVPTTHNRLGLRLFDRQRRQQGHRPRAQHRL